MARVFVGDCLAVVPNRFELSVLAAFRARELNAGAPPAAAAAGHNGPVQALKDIASGLLDPIALEDRLVRSLQREAPLEEEAEQPPVFDQVDEATLMASIDKMKHVVAQRQNECD